MPWVKYPFHVRHDHMDYAPGEVIEVADATEHVERGAEEVFLSTEEERKSAPKKRKTTAPAREQ